MLVHLWKSAAGDPQPGWWVSIEERLAAHRLQEIQSKKPRMIRGALINNFLDKFLGKPVRRIRNDRRAAQIGRTREEVLNDSATPTIILDIRTGDMVPSGLQNVQDGTISGARVEPPAEGSSPALGKRELLLTG
jgi:hypothetical protein